MRREGFRTANYQDRRVGNTAPDNEKGSVLYYTILVIDLHLSRVHLILRNTKKMKMLRRSLLLRILLEYSNTGPQHHDKVPARHYRDLVDAAFPCETQLLTQSLSCEAHSFTWSSSHEAHFTITGLIGCEGAQVLHRWAHCSDSRGHGDSQSCRQDRDTMMHQSVRSEVLIFSGLGLWLLLCQFGYVSA